MRVILVNKFHYRKGGSETYYFSVADALRKMGHEVHFFAMEDEKNEPCEDADLFVSNRDYNGPSSLVAKASAALSIVYSGEAKRRFQVLCERIRPDVVHLNLVHRQITLSILDAPYLARHKVPVVWTAHDYIGVCPSYTMLDSAGEVCDACVGGHFSSCLKRKCVKGSTAKSGMAMLEAEFLKLTGVYCKIDRIICPSRFLSEKMIEGGFPRNLVTWMPNFIPDEVIEEIVPEGDGHNPDSNPYLLYFGRLSAEKGVDLLIRAFASARPSLPDEWRLKIAGTGSMEEELKRITSESGVSDRVDFLGYQTGAPLRSLIAGALWSIVPSTWRENMPYSIVESLVAGTPVIGSDIGGIPELVTDGKTGLLCRACSVEDLSRALVRAAGMSARAHLYMANNGRAFAEGSCSQGRYMDALVSLYSELISEKKGN